LFFLGVSVWIYKAELVLFDNIFQVEINIHQFFKGYTEGRMHKDMWPEMLKLKDWPPSNYFEERLPRHGTEFISALPFKEYAHPKCGLLNLATKLPANCLKPDLGPKNIYSLWHPGRTW
jgi:lysine-specific demethylase 3